jgi:hypothetical protein
LKLFSVPVKHTVQTEHPAHCIVLKKVYTFY